MINSKYADELISGILNMYKMATSDETTFQKKIEIKHDLKQLLLSCVDQGVESPISINKVNRIAIPNHLETLTMKIEMAIENLKFLNYRYGDDPRNIANNFLNFLLETAIATTDENSLNLPKTLSIQEIMNILDTVPLFKDDEDETDYPAINTLLDMLTTLGDLLEDAKKWHISEELKYLTLEETFNLIQTFHYLNNNRGNTVQIKLT